MREDTHEIPISELDGFQQVADTMAGRPLCHFNRVYSFRYFGRQEDDQGDEWRNIELVMEEFDPPHAQVGIRCHRVSDVSFSGYFQILGLNFRSIRDRGWDQLCFEVGDYEDGGIHLYCFAISLFDPPHQV